MRSRGKEREIKVLTIKREVEKEEEREELTEIRYEDSVLER